MKRLDAKSRSGFPVLPMLLLGAALLAFGCNDDGDDGAPGPEGAQGPAGPTGPAGPPGAGVGNPVVAIEACVGCHGAGEVEPVGDISSAMDAHYFGDSDLTRPPPTGSGYRELNVEITAVDVSRTVDPDSVIIDFEVTDENGAPVTDLFAADGRFSIARLNPEDGTGNASSWQSFINRVENPGAAIQATAERFTSGTFQANTPGPGQYRYISDFDPADSPPVTPAGPGNPIGLGDTIRVAIQLSAGDLPGANGWCDFDANTAAPNNDCDAASRTRDIVQTATCNGCHGVTPDTKLALHGGGRTDVEYCVTCHNPGTTDAQSGNVVDMTQLIHKIHYGSELENGYQIVGFGGSVHDYSTVSFTKDIDDCTVCHSGGGADEDHWSMVPTLTACGSCHDDVDFTTGANHGTGGVQDDNDDCAFCHPQVGAYPSPGGLPQPIEAVHLGVERRMEGALYAGGANGFRIDDLMFNPSNRQLTIDFMVTRGGTPMTLETAPEWNAGGGASRLAITAGWNTSDYDNADSGRDPAQPLSINGLDVGGAVTALGGGLYRTTTTLPSAATAGTVAVGMEGHPAADLDGDGTYSDRIAVVNDVVYIDATSGRVAGTMPRRQVVDIGKCNACHDAAGNGISLHGNNRTGTDEVCVLCHNANATDISRRPAPPAMTADGKPEETIDFKRMIHQIHSGAELEDGVIIYGFGGSVNDFSHVEFIGNLANCETCHMPDTYSTEDASNGLPTTIETGADRSDPDDDLNISQTASVCSSCHDGAAEIDHMKLNGASFQALDEDIH